MDGTVRLGTGSKKTQKLDANELLLNHTNGKKVATHFAVETVI